MKKIRVGWCIDTIVDDEDYEYLSQWNWHLCSKGYAIREERMFGVRKSIRMNRVVLERKLGHDDFEVAEHKNRVKLDNRRKNLRPSTNQENCRNRGKQKNSTSKYKGVFWHTRDEKWYVQIGVDRKNIYLGLYDDEIEAARAYDVAAIKYFDEFICLNFPRSDYD